MSLNGGPGEETIGLFGATGSTGKEFLKLALDAGYTIKALAPNPNDVTLENEKLTVIEGTYDDEDAIDEVVCDAHYVVCLASETMDRKEYKEGFMMDFVRLLYPIMKEYRPYLFLYQASSLSIDGNGKIPVFSNITNKTTRVLFGPNLRVKDNDDVIRYIAENKSRDDFDFIVTRPGLCREGPSKKKLFASKSQPGPIPVTNADLAEFTLGALKNEKLYNRYPYVVGDGF